MGAFDELFIRVSLLLIGVFVVLLPSLPDVWQTVMDCNYFSVAVTSVTANKMPFSTHTLTLIPFAQASSGF